LSLPTDFNFFSFDVDDEILIAVGSSIVILLFLGGVTKVSVGSIRESIFCLNVDRANLFFK